MARNEGTPGAGRRTGAPKSVVFAGDTAEISPALAEIQIAKVRARFNVGVALAAEIAGLAYPALDDWRVSR